MPAFNWRAWRPSGECDSRARSGCRGSVGHFLAWRRREGSDRGVGERCGPVVGDEIVRHRIVQEAHNPAAADHLRYEIALGDCAVQRFRNERRARALDQQIDSRSGGAAVRLGQRHLLTDDGRDIGIERE